MATATKTKKKDNRGRSEKIRTPIVRVSFPHVHKPDTGREYSQGKYLFDALIEKEREEELKPLKKACLDAARQVWPKIKWSELQTPFKDGDEKDGADGYKGMIYFTPKSSRKPGIVGPDAQPLDEDQEVYGGCYVRATVNAYTYEQSKKVEVEGKDGKISKKKRNVKGVTLGLHNIQFVKDGERFGDVSSAEDDFDPIDVEELDLDEDEAFEDDDEDTEAEASEEEDDDDFS